VKWWAVAVLLMVIDVAFDVLGIHASTTATRVGSGLFFGINAALILTPLFLETLVTFITIQYKQGVSYESKTR